MYLNTSTYLCFGAMTFYVLMNNVNSLVGADITKIEIYNDIYKNIYIYIYIYIYINNNKNNKNNEK